MRTYLCGVVRSIIAGKVQAAVRECIQFELLQVTDAGSIQITLSPNMSAGSSHAVARLQSKPALKFSAMQKLWEKTSLELSESRNHPAADLELPPACLLVYTPEVARKLFNDRDFIDTPIGRACREWNSRNGIPYLTWCLILSSASMCSSCHRMFSIDGYNAHVVNGVCTRHLGSPAPPQAIRAPLHPASNSSKPPPELQAYNFNLAFTLFDVPDHLHSAIGRAFVEWNSCLGVPYAVWHMISTSLVHCSACGLVRSFDGDTDHRRVGRCGLIGTSKGPVDEGEGVQ
jgi:hypothetical protein